MCGVCVCVCVCAVLGPVGLKIKKSSRRFPSLGGERLLLQYASLVVTDPYRMECVVCGVGVCVCAVLGLVGLGAW